MDVPPAEVTELAARRGFGSYVLTETLGGSGSVWAGLVIVALTAVPGIGLIVGPYGTPVKALGVVLILLAVVIPVHAVRHGRRAHARASRLHAFESGLILARDDDLRPYLWNEIEAVNRMETYPAGQQLNQRRPRLLELRARDGTILATLDERQRLNRIQALARRP